MVIPKDRNSNRYNDPDVFTGRMDWNLQELSRALRLTESQTRSYFTDGRRSGFLVENRIINQNKTLTAASKNATYDARDKKDMWEIRTLTARGVSFVPSIDIGGGRSFNKIRFEQKLQDVAGFIVCDISTFPDVPYWSIPSRIIIRWHHHEILKKGKFSYKKAMEQIKKLY